MTTRVLPLPGPTRRCVQHDIKKYIVLCVYIMVCAIIFSRNSRTCNNNQRIARCFYGCCLFVIEILSFAVEWIFLRRPNDKLVHFTLLSMSQLWSKAYTQTHVYHLVYSNYTQAYCQTALRYCDQTWSGTFPLDCRDFCQLTKNYR